MDNSTPPVQLKTSTAHKFVEIAVDPAKNHEADLLCVYSGFIECHIQGASPDFWNSTPIVANIETPGRQWQSGEAPPQGPNWTAFRQGALALTLAKIFNENYSANAGWSIDEAEVEPDGTGHLQVKAKIGIRDSDGLVLRLGYQLTALGKVLS